MRELHDLLNTDPAAGLCGVGALMRERAEAADDSGGGAPWYSADDLHESIGGGSRNRADSIHIAAAGPPFVLAVADLLSRVADDYDIAKHGYWSAVAEKIARAYLGPADA